MPLLSSLVRVGQVSAQAGTSANKSAKMEVGGGDTTVAVIFRRSKKTVVDTVFKVPVTNRYELISDISNMETETDGEGQKEKDRQLLGR
uniref:Putative secreted protein n=1 Tax=Xenopsylla cheopis TaxID=163159 RepID=A0A6M2DW11_XENCH